MSKQALLENEVLREQNFDMNKTIAEQKKEIDAIKQENAELRQQLAFAKAFADPPDIKTGQTVRDELKAENERTNAKIAKYQALVRYWIPCTAERKIAEIEST